MNDTLLKFKEVVDEEILAYESLGDLYELKQSILIQGKSDALWDVDAKITETAGVIREINQKRKEVARYLGNEDFTMSEIIEQARAANDELVGNLESQKNKLRILANALSLQEKTNMTLVQHGLTMVGKALDIIVGAIMPQIQAGQYDKSGKNIESDSSMISSIVEEV